MKSILLASFLFLLAEFSFAEELTNYTITSDSQVNTLEGDLEAKGNVVIKSNSDNFEAYSCLLYTSPSPRDALTSRMPSSA